MVSEVCNWLAVVLFIYEHINVDDDWCCGCEAALEKIFDPSSTQVLVMANQETFHKNFI